MFFLEEQVAFLFPVVTKKANGSCFFVVFFERSEGRARTPPPLNCAVTPLSVVRSHQGKNCHSYKLTVTLSLTFQHS